HTIVAPGSGCHPAARTADTAPDRTARGLSFDTSEVSGRARYRDRPARAGSGMGEYLTVEGSCGGMAAPTGQMPTPAAIQNLWDRAGVVLGATEFAALISSHRDGSAMVRHRLIDQLLRLDDARNGRLSLVAQDAAFVSMSEVDSVLTLADEWQSSPAWPE